MVNINDNDSHHLDSNQRCVMTVGIMKTRLCPMSRPCTDIMILECNGLFR